MTGAIDFEAEARAKLGSYADALALLAKIGLSRQYQEEIAAKLREVAEREGQDGYTRGQAEGFRRGVEACRQICFALPDDHWINQRIRALLAPEPAKCTCVDRLDAFGTRNPNPGCPFHGARR
jgi:flagellar biosynthesis/type III secretory pathway protein FliH